MRHVPLSAFKDNASAYIAAAEQGDEIIITRHGRPAAKLVTAADQEERRRRAEAAVEWFKGHRERMRAERRTATVEELIEWKNEGRR
jgi:prevent-host-death family protein